MSKYTTELRWLCENYVENHRDELTDYDLNTVDGIINASRGYVFDFDYPIFDENYRGVLENKIIKHYYTREICAETVGRWKLFLNSRLNEIMPYYNKLYDSELLEFNPFYDADYTKSGNKSGSQNGNEMGSTSKNTIGTNTNTLTGSVTDGFESDVSKSVSENTRSADSGSDERTKTGSTSSTDGGTDVTTVTDTPITDRWEYYNDTPQGSVGNLASLDYLTNARHITETGAGSTKTDRLQHGKTNSGTVSETDETEYGKINTGTMSGTETIGKDEERNISKSETDTLNKSESVSGTNSLSKMYTNTGQYIEHVVGKMPGASYSRLLKEFRETLLNIDKDIIDELKDLFFGLW